MPDLALAWSACRVAPRLGSCDRPVTVTQNTRAAAAVAGRGDRDVGGAAAEVLAERLDRPQGHPDLERVDVDADPPHGEDVEGCHLHRAASPTGDASLSGVEKVSLS